MVVPLRPDDRSSGACPLGICDGTGWIDGPENVAVTVPLALGTGREARMRGIRSGRYRGVPSASPSTGRP